MSAASALLRGAETGGTEVSQHQEHSHGTEPLYSSHGVEEGMLLIAV